MVAVENYYALTLAILNSNFSADKAINMFIPKVEMGRGTIKDVDTNTLIELKKTMSYREIGQIYGVGVDAVYKRLRQTAPNM